MDPVRLEIANTLRPYGHVRTNALNKLARNHEELEDSLRRGLAEGKGATKLLAQIDKLTTDLRKAEDDLCSLGFGISEDGDLTWSSKIPMSIRKNIAKKVYKELGTVEDLHQRFDLAVMRVYASPTVDEAQKVVEVLVNGSK